MRQEGEEHTCRRREGEENEGSGSRGVVDGALHHIAVFPTTMYVNFRSRPWNGTWTGSTLLSAITEWSGEWCVLAVCPSEFMFSLLSAPGVPTQ